MEHVNIISQEAITAVPSWLAALGAGICIAIVASTFIYMAIIKDPSRVIRYLSHAGAFSLVLCVAWCIITSAFFSVPTGRYRYEATIDKENMSITEYEEFMKAYDHSYSKDGIYYFEDWPN